MNYKLKIEDPSSKDRLMAYSFFLILLIFIVLGSFGPNQLTSKEQSIALRNFEKEYIFGSSDISQINKKIIVAIVFEKNETIAKNLSITFTCNFRSRNKKKFKNIPSKNFSNVQIFLKNGTKRTNKIILFKSYINFDYLETRIILDYRLNNYIYDKLDKIILITTIEDKFCNLSQIYFSVVFSIIIISFSITLLIKQHLNLFNSFKKEQNVIIVFIVLLLLSNNPIGLLYLKQSNTINNAFNVFKVLFEVWFTVCMFVNFDKAKFKNKIIKHLILCTKVGIIFFQLVALIVYNFKESVSAKHSVLILYIILFPFLLFLLYKTILHQEKNNAEIYIMFYLIFFIVILNKILGFSVKNYQSKYFFFFTNMIASNIFTLALSYFF